MTDRLVLDVTPDPHRKEPQRPQPFSAFSDYANVVLLGDPGAGKTHLFEEAAEAACGQYVKARSFLLKPNFRSDAALFIDALDETRAGRGDQNIVDEFIRKLFDIKPKKVRISCRAADWLGDTDLAAFKIYFEDHGGVAVLSLQVLERQEQIEILTIERLPKRLVSISEAHEFLNETEERGLQEFAYNPQNLLMLWDAVEGSGIWPSTRKELFELSVQVMLEENNKDRQRQSAGSFQPHEIRDAAGALCAVRLISNVAGISFQQSGDGPDFPSYRSLTFLDPQKAEGALSRRVFAAGERPESMDYAHRTTAEFLGAEWVAKQVVAGLPIGRVLALTGIDHRPATELRGLHAWLAVFLPSLTNLLVDTDPYGVLLYGDAAALSPLSRQHLLSSIARLSIEDPGFRSERRHSPALGMLAQTDMIEAFREVLVSSSTNFSLRSVVMDALASGPPLQPLLPDLTAILLDERAPFAERSNAVAALERMGDHGKRELILFCRSKRAFTEDSFRLTDGIAATLYGQGINAGDVVELCANVARYRKKCASTSLLWRIAELVPVFDIPKVINAFRPPSIMSERLARWPRIRAPNRSIVARTLERLFIRYLQAIGERADASEILRWLQLRHAHRGSSTTFERELADALRACPASLHSVAVLFFGSLKPEQGDHWLWHMFVEMTLSAYDRRDLAKWLTEALPSIDRGSPKQKLFLRVAAAQCWHDGDWGIQQFEKLAAVVCFLPELQSVFEAETRCVIEDWRQRDLDRKAEENRQISRTLADTRKKLQRDVVSVRAGTHDGWLDWATNIYFGYADFVDNSLEPRQRVISVVGTTDAEAFFAGFATLLKRPDIPTPAEVAAKGTEGRRKIWWWALMAAVDLKWASERDLMMFSDDFWRAALAINQINPVIEHNDKVVRQRKPAWQDIILDKRPELACEVYEAIARTYLSAGREIVEGLHELLHEPRLAVGREDRVFSLLRSFPGAPLFKLDQMLVIALGAEARRQELLSMARQIRANASDLDSEILDRWLAVGFLAAPSEFQIALRERMKADRSFAWRIRNLTGGHHGHVLTFPLSIDQLEALILAIGSQFPNTPYPFGMMSGDQNVWDASDYIRALINRLSAMVDRSATDALGRLLQNFSLSTYADALRHGSAQQRTRRRDAEYDRPDWEKAATTLSNGRPTNTGDLWALTADHLESLALEIRSANTDPYKQYWNVDSYGRVLEPRPEEACRDALLMMMRSRLAPAGIIAEPEGHMANDKRADITVAARGMKVVIELKKDSHEDVWHAAESQLDRLYTRDPESKGFGVYGVFWFGEKRNRPVPLPPNSKPGPRTASEMAVTLRQLLPVDKRNRIAVTVFDVSAP